MLNRLIAALAAPLLLTACATTAPASNIGPETATLPAGVAAGNDPRVSAIGSAILARGGSATDAGVAMLFALSVLEPQSSGIGGGAFYVRGSADGEVETIDGREAAPAAATPDWFLDAEGKPLPFRQAVASGLSIGVPGAVALAAEAHAKHGKLPWRDVVQPAIDLARGGFTMNPRLNESLDDYTATSQRDPDALAAFFGPDGKAPAVGETVRLPALADTLERIASGGAAAFYRGPLAEKLASEIASDTPRPAGMTAADLAGYEAKERPAICGTYRLYRVCGMGPPSSGSMAVIAILGQLEQYDLAALGPENIETWHLFLESQRLAYADKEYWLGDSDYVDVPLEGLLDPAYMAARGRLIDPNRTMPDPEPGRPDGAPQVRVDGPEYPENGTTNYVAVDSAGNMVSINATVEGAFGSGLFIDGFYLNNELTDFTFAPGGNGEYVANRVEGGKRPRSSMSPMVIYDPQGRPFMAVGAAGGMMIPVQTARAIIGAIDFKLPLKQALGLPFIMDFGQVVAVEKGTWLEGAVPQLEALGHQRVIVFDRLLRTTGALRSGDGWEAAYDPRLEDLVRIP